MFYNSDSSHYFCIIYYDYGIVTKCKSRYLIKSKSTYSITKCCGLVWPPICISQKRRGRVPARLEIVCPRTVTWVRGALALLSVQTCYRCWIYSQVYPVSVCRHPHKLQIRLWIKAGVNWRISIELTVTSLGRTKVATAILSRPQETNNEAWRQSQVFQCHEIRRRNGYEIVIHLSI